MGYVRGAHVCIAQQESTAAQEVHQDCSSVRPPRTHSEIYTNKSACIKLGFLCIMIFFVCVCICSCKAQRNLNSAFAIIMGLNTAAVSRLNQTWEVSVCVDAFSVFIHRF